MIDIPGYQLIRPLGSGAMANVYLARDIATDRDVALKVISPALLADSGFAARFLREARIAARLSHPHIVKIHDVAHFGDSYYVAMEYLAGGAVLDQHHTPRTLDFTLRVVREIAAALGYVHGQGFVHRDVKTDNLLLREDGSAVLTDFGIVRANSAAARITLAGTVIGTPQYMSPEQARGGDVDGRSDLYALGIIMFELLTGRVPFDADDSFAVGLRHADDPLPQLPEDFVVAQPLLDRLLAKQPAQRFQTGDEVVEAIAELERSLPRPPVVRAIDTVELADVMIEPWLDMETRQQPELGTLDGLDDALEQRVSSRPRLRKRSQFSAVLPVLIGVVLLVAAVAAWIYQDGLRAMLPETQLNRLLEQGSRALAEGRIDGSGDAALESFRRARELEQDNEVARSGLAKVSEQLLQRGRDALARKDFVAARNAVATARDLRGGGADIDALTRDIAAAASGRDDEAQLLEAADKALTAKRIVGVEGAVASYRKLESSEHGVAIARAGLLKAGKQLEIAADSALAKGDLPSASARIDDLAGNLPEYPGLADLRGRLAAARQKGREQNARLIADAQQRLRDGDVSESDGSALSLYRRVLKNDPENGEAKDGLRRIAQALLVRADAAIEDGDIEVASLLLSQAATLAPSSDELRQAQTRLRDLGESRDIQDERPQLDAADGEQVRQLLVQGKAAARRGALMDPPQSSAYDYYRAALAIDPDNVAATDGLLALPELARRRFRDRMYDGDVSAALAELDVIRQLAPDDPRIDRDMSELLDASLALAATRIGEGRRVDAERALEIARRIDPERQELADLERELAMLRR